MKADELRAKLGGLAHTRLESGPHRRAAVLVALEPELGVWLTRRSNNLPNHAGQVAFAGGKIETADASPEAAALREAKEEIGLDPASVELLGRMDDYITGSGFHIAPVIGLLAPGTRFTPAPGEVASVFTLTFATLLNPAAPRRRRVAVGGVDREFWVWPDDEHFIWGATAEILVRLAKILRNGA